MSGFFRILVVVVAVGCASAAGAEPPLQLAPREGALLLRNGQVILGKIIPAGDHYVVSCPPHAEYRFPTSEVDLLCKDLEEVYERKRARVKLASAADHVDLADWCLKNDLIDHADTELSYALAADANYPRIRLLERRLALARRDDTAPPPARHKTADRGPTNDELDRFIRGMPSHAVESFTSTIQPLLINNCTTSGCHAPSSDAKLHLFRIPPGSPPTRRTTQRNLYAVWQQLNTSNPAASPLLTVATQKHGNCKSAVFTDRQADQYQQLAAWVSLFGQGRKLAQPASVAAPSAPLLQTMPPAATPARQALESSNVPGAASHAKPGGKSGGSSAGAKLESLDGQGSAETKPPRGPDERSAQSDRKPLKPDYVPVDPFDPEVFNRKYHPDE